MHFSIIYAAIMVLAGFFFYFTLRLWNEAGNYCHSCIHSPVKCQFSSPSDEEDYAGSVSERGDDICASFCFLSNL